MKNRFASRLFQIAFYSDLHASRFALALAEFIWAVTLLWPGDTFGRPTYHIMSQVMTEEAWGALFLLTSVLQFSILMEGRYHSRFAIVFACYNAVMWWFVCVSMYMSVFPPPAAISGELALAFAASWIWIRSGYVIVGRRATDHDGHK